MDLGTGTVAGVGTVREAGGSTVTGTEVGAATVGAATVGEATVGEDTVGDDTGAVAATDLGTVRGIEARTSSGAGIETGVALTLVNETGITGFITKRR